MIKLTQIWISVFMLCFCGSLHSQVKSKLLYSLGINLYDRYTNPKQSDSLDSKGRSSGGVFSTPIGLAWYIGKNNFSVSFETQINLNLLAFDLPKYKGLMAVSAPLMVYLNSGGLSSFSHGKIIGFAIGGGIQYQITDLIFKPSRYDNLNRDLFPTYVGEIAFGGGFGGKTGKLFIRLGYGKNQTHSANIGFLLNSPFSKKPNSNFKIELPSKEI